MGCAQRNKGKDPKIGEVGGSARCECAPGVFIVGFGGEIGRYFKSPTGISAWLRVGRESSGLARV